MGVKPQIIVRMSPFSQYIYATANMYWCFLGGHCFKITFFACTVFSENNFESYLKLSWE